MGLHSTASACALTVAAVLAICAAAFSPAPSPPPVSLRGFALRVLPSTKETFYVGALGMRSAGSGPTGEPRFTFASQQSGQVLELSTAKTNTTTPLPLDDCTQCPCYWLMGLLVADAANAAEALRTAPATKGYYVTPKADVAQFRDVGTMAEVVDDSGMQSELLQRSFGARPLVSPPPRGQFDTASTQGLAFRTADRGATLQFWTEALGFVLALDQRVEPYGFGLLFLIAPDSMFSLAGFRFPGPTHGPTDPASGNFTGNGDRVPVSMLEQTFMQIQVQYFFGPAGNTTVAPFAPPDAGEAGFERVLLAAADAAAVVSHAAAVNASFVKNGELVEPNGIPVTLEPL